MKKKKFKSTPLIWYFLVPFLLVLCYKYISSSRVNDYSDVEIKDASVLASEETIPEKIDYIFHVKPILSDRCYLCHGPDEGTREAGLRFDTKDGAYAALGENKDRFALVPGDTTASQMVHRILAKEESKIMPPINSNLSLTDYEKQILVKWIGQGAVWKDHWAFVKPKKPEIPNIFSENKNGEIDKFILRKLKEKGLSMSEKASKEKLIRRVYFDLTGLPPSIEAIDTFIKDNGENAFETVIDNLLASKAYGERMAAIWLDVARYSDTHGYQDDLERIMWPWRDWVISAFNRNIPYDQFVKWQLAGDLIPNATREQILATGFNRNHKITQEGGVIDEEYRNEYVLDRTNTVSKSLLGLTMECAQCHDHKYDPISQKEYFSFYAFFNKLDEKGRMDYGEIPEPNIRITQQEVKDVLTFINMPDSINELDLMVMKDSKPNRKTYILKRGAYDNFGEEVKEGVPQAVLSFTDKYQKNRLGLSDWLFDEDNTLTARVAVNRLWQQIFGIGIVATSSDFGNQGALPSHPELLDWLAETYREEGWDTKKMLKRMVMSQTYQQTTKATPELLEIDPTNKWLARSSREKLTAEMIRDNALAASGLLVDKLGGPSVKPYQPKGLWAETTSGQGLTEYIMDKGENLYRRSLYTFWKRTVPPPAMLTFDAATRDFCSVERQKTSTPLQALVMLNDPQLIEASEVLAAKMLKDENLSDKERIKIIFRRITSRTPEDSEVEKLITFLKDTESNYNEIEKEDFKLKQEYQDLNIPKKRIYAFTTLTSLIFNLDEAIVKG
ncbi:PSD1 and planctomycete cytochrome C domain-containing protein [uncultured Winogradskyella sp.]|uniref:PSD1 and planctomycete cytochrome C domain-containing protein n=1 Tax=uncultured Winogradskyella sp. TaxID=395353 RepID=UPI00262F031F|nr:PSD1 and planctomycete cytochrome C domain-containing protein [uncultured Winogradskyella sp.]